MDNMPEFSNDPTIMKMFSKLTAKEQQDVMDLVDSDRIGKIKELYKIHLKEAIAQQYEIARNPKVVGGMIAGGVLPLDLGEDVDPNIFDVIGEKVEEG